MKKILRYFAFGADTALLACIRRFSISGNLEQRRHRRSFAITTILGLAIAGNVSAQPYPVPESAGFRVIERQFEYCPGPNNAPRGPGGICPVFNQTWGHRQHINYGYSIDGQSGKITQWLKLQNHATFDGDTVCFGVNFYAGDRIIYTFYERWGINGRGLSRNPRVREQVFVNDAPAALWKEATKVKTYWRECSKWDDKAFWRPIVAAAVVVCSAYTGAPQGCGAAGAAALGERDQILGQKR